MAKKYRHSILMLHGLGGSPAEMAYLQGFFEHKGYFVHTPLLPRHGTHFLDLRNLTISELVTFSQKELNNLFEKSEQVSVVGLCMGAVLALKLGIDHPEKITSIVPISTTMIFDGWGLPRFKSLLSLFRYTPAYYLYNLEESEPYGVKNPTIRKWLAEHLSASSTTHYSKIPLKSIFLMKDLVAQVRKGLTQIKSPTFAIHAKEDEVCSLANLALLENSIDKSLFNKLILYDSYHLATIDQERSVIAKKCLQFLSVVGATSPQSTALDFHPTSINNKSGIAS